MHPHPIGNGNFAPRVPRSFAALMDALQMQGPSHESLLRLSPREWDELLAFSDLAHLTLALANRDLSEFPAWVRQRLARNLRDNRERFKNVYARYREVSEALDRAGIPHVVLKGFTQAPEFVSDPHLRMQSDIDLFCPPEQVWDADAVVRGLGYESSGDVDYYRNADHLPTLGRAGTWKWQGNAFDPTMPPSIEIHFCLWNEKTMLLAVPEIEQFWRRRIAVHSGEMAWVSLDTADKLAFLSLHIVRDVLAGDWVVNRVFELASFLQARADDTQFWDEWVNLHSLPLRQLQVIAFSLARSWFSCPMPKIVTEVVNALPASQQCWLRRFGGSPLEVMFRRNKDGRLLHLLLGVPPQARMAIVLKALLPNKVSSPSAAARRAPYRKVLRDSPHTPLLWSYAKYICERTWVNLEANAELLYHSTSLWISNRSLKRPLWLFLGASFFFDLGLSVYFFLFNIFLIKRGFSESQLGLITGAMAAGSLVGALPAGVLTRWIGLKRALMACQLAAPLVLCARTWPTTLAAQMVLATMTGLCLCLWAVCLSPMAAAVTDEKNRSTAFSLLFSLGIGLGAAGGLIGSRMPGWFDALSRTPARLAPDQLTLLAAAGIAFLGIFCTAALPDISVEKAVSPRPLFSPALLRFFLAVAVWGFVTGSFSPFANVYFAQHLHMPLVNIGTVFSVSQLFQVGVVLAAPHLFKRGGDNRGVFYALLTVCVCLVLLGGELRAPVAGCVFILLTGAQWMIEPSIYSKLMSLAAPEQRGGASASMALVLAGANLISATVAGWSYSRLGYPHSLGLIAIVALIAGLLFKTMPDSRDQKELVVREPAPADV